MRALAPQYLLLLPCLFWFWWQGRRRAATLRATSVRCAVAALVVLALSQLQVIHGESRASVMMLVDASDSTVEVRSSMLARANRLLSALRPEDEAGLVAFGRTPQVERALSTARAPFGSIEVQVTGTATDIEEALRLARTLLPRNGVRRVVLLSDGQQNRGDAMKEAARAAQEGIAIDVWLPEATTARAMSVTSLSAPPSVRLGQPFALTAVVQGKPESVGELTIERDREVQLAREVVLSADGTATAVFTDAPSAPGVRTYTARVRSSEPLPGDTAPAAGAVVTVIGPARVLYVRDRSVNAGPAFGGGFQIDQVEPALLPRSGSALDTYDAVVLDDLMSDALDQGQTAALSAFVEQRGGGLLVLGSARSLDAGYFPDTPLGALLPIDLRPRTGQRAPQAGLVVVYDKSGSMDDRVDGTSKIEYARQGIQKILEVVPPTDAVGVIAFDSRPTEVVALRPGHDPRAVIDRVRAIEPGGSTAIAPAMEMARDWLTGGEAARFSKRHILLISDGRSSAEDANRLAALAKGPFELSIVALGADSDRRFLSSLATASGGRAYVPEQVRDLPSILAREAARVAGGRLVDEAFTARVLTHPATTGLEGQKAPRLSGYVVSAAKPRAEVVVQSHLDDPILAGWKYGLGRVAAYTADLRGPWSSGLRAWPSSAPLLAQTMRWLARPLGQGVLYTSVVPSDEGVRLLVDTGDGAGEYMSLLDVQATVRSPSGETIVATAAEAQPGRYETTLPLKDEGAYVVTIEASSTDHLIAARAQRGFYWRAATETSTQGVNATLLRSLAQTTGGEILGATRDPLSERPPGYLDLRAYLLATAFLIFLGELLLPIARDLRFTRRARLGHQPQREAA